MDAPILGSRASDHDASLESKPGDRQRNFLRPKRHNFLQDIMSTTAINERATMEQLAERMSAAPDSAAITCDVLSRVACID